MGSRGRGGRGRGGRGRGSGGIPFAAPIAFELFPELPENTLPLVRIDDIRGDDNMRSLLKRTSQLQNYWKASPYLVEDATSKDIQRVHIERHSDRNKTTFTRDSLSQILVFTHFPKELVQGASNRVPSRKKYRWNPESGIKKFDLFEQLEKKNQGREDKGEKENKDGEDEDEDENAEDEEDEEDFGDDDYLQNEYFDDDEDDYNDADDGGDDEGGVY